MFICIPFQAGYNTKKLVNYGEQLISKISEYKNKHGVLPKNLDDLIPSYVNPEEKSLLNDNFFFKTINSDLYVIEIHTWYLYSEFYRYYWDVNKFIKTDD